MWSFHVGDRVTVRDDIMVGEKFGSNGEDKPTCNFVEDMEKFKGRKVTIAKTYKNSIGRFRYRIKEDNGFWSWADEMFQEYIYPDGGDFDASTAEELMSFLGSAV